MTFASVALPKPFHHLFTYRVPEELAEQVQIGSRIVVPFRNKKMIGFCWKLDETPPKEFAAEKIKTILEVKDAAPIFSLKMVELIQWMSDYYAAPIGEVCRMALPPRLCQTEARAKAKPTLPEENHEAFFQPDTVRLTPEQQTALEQIRAQTKLAKRQPILLHGITGSGKTEIYIQFLQTILAGGQQGILLVPEIGLTPQLLGRLQSRLPSGGQGLPASRVVLYHSGLTDARRTLIWEEMREGKIQVAVGTRSALFAPFPNLGGIIVDEEHDSSYKQEDGSIRYHARDVATMRAKLESATIVLGSATPSLESVFNAKKGKYDYLYLSKRATGAKLPEISLLDLKSSKLAPQCKAISVPLQQAIAENLYRGEQTLLLLNRRGFASFLLCEECGKSADCPNCSIALTYHRSINALLCHYCEYKIPLRETCSHCKSPKLELMGQGTQSLEGELRQLFPESAIFRLDRDTTTKRASRHQTLQQMKQGKIDILVGTQLVTKGHDFPNVTLVGVILADASLHFPDFRATERTFQLLTQVAGRSGRGSKPGKVLIQTYAPDHVTLQLAQSHNFEQFCARELKNREGLNYPPFSRLTQIRLQGGNEPRVKETALQLRQNLSAKEGLQILGPAKAPLAKIRGKFRWQILLKTNQRRVLDICLAKIRLFQEQQLASRVQILVDVDCINTL